MTSPDPVLPAARRGEAVKELVGLLLMALGVCALCLLAYDVDPRLLLAIGAAVLTVVGWRMTIKEE